MREKNSLVFSMANLKSNKRFQAFVNFNRQRIEYSRITKRQTENKWQRRDTREGVP